MWILRSENPSTCAKRGCEVTTTPATATKTYIIDNGRAYSLHTVYFVEAVAADFEPLFALYAKAWPETCLRCNSTYHQCRCKYREMAETCHVIAVSSSFDWRVGKAMTVAEWLEAIEPSIGENVADIEAAKAFVETARRWLSWFCEYRSLEFEPRGAGQVAL